MSLADQEILVVGHVALDLIFRVPQMPGPGHKQPATELQVAIGGPACNAAITIRRLGGSCTLLARIGSDAFGRMIEQELGTFGIETGSLCRVQGATSSVSSVYVDDAGERQVVNILPASLTAEQDLGPTLHELGRGRYCAILGDSRWPQACEQIFESPAAQGITRVVDFERPSDELVRACHHATHVFFSEDGLRLLTGRPGPVDGLHDAERLFDATVGVTVGELGTYWIEDGKLCHEQAFQVQTRETLAAGDVWHGAVTLALAQGKALHAAIRRANAVAALKCTRSGGSRGMPTTDEFLNFLEQVKA